MKCVGVRGAFVTLIVTCFGCPLWIGACANVGGTPTIEERSPFRHGQQTHILFGFNGSEASASDLRDVADSGICDDPRVQRFVTALLEEFESRSISTESNFSLSALSDLGEPRSFWGPVSEAQVIPDPDGEEQFVYLWKLPDGGEMSLSENRFRSYASRSFVLATFVRRQGTDRIDLRFEVNVSSPRKGPRAVPALEKRNAPTQIYGVMGIVVDRHRAQLPPGFVVNTAVSITIDARFKYNLLDDIIIAALNATVQPNEIVQFYRHASHEEFGDSDYRVADYMDSVKNAVLIKRPEASE